MSYTIRNILVVLALMSIQQKSFCQEENTQVIPPDISTKYFDAVSKKAERLDNKLDKKSEKALAEYEKQTRKLKRKLSKIDSSSAVRIFGDADKKYKALTQKLKQKSKLTKYIPSLDTMGTSLKFLDQYKGTVKNTKELQSAISKVNELKSEIQKAEDIKQFLKEQKQYLKDNLDKFGMGKQLKKLNKQAYYYSQQLKEYKETLKDQQKIERKTIELLSKTKPFQDFMKKNSMLASLFRMPNDGGSDPASMESLAGLQTRGQVDQLVNQQVGAGGAASMEQMKGNMQQARTEFNQLKDKINKAGGNNSDDEIPDFKPNMQKTKSFLDRIEYGTSMQTVKSNSYFPVTSDIGLSAGYKLNDKSIIGIGASYKMGWGQNIQHINITHQGAGLRSFADWKLKKSFWLSGGFEINYNTSIKTIEQLKDASAWQQSGLIGISKKFPVKTKFIKNTNLKLLWDFLSYQQVPRTQPILFRVGYNLK